MFLLLIITKACKILSWLRKDLLNKGERLTFVLKLSRKLYTAFYTSGMAMTSQW